MNWPLARRRGGLLALLAVVVGSVSAAIAADSNTDLAWLTIRTAGGGLVLLALGVVVGSGRLVGFSALPVFVAAVVGVDPDAGPSWLRSLIIGVSWYAATELAWASIERRDEVARSDAVDRRRRQEVATVVVVSLLVGIGGTLLGSFAPTRTLLVRGSLIAAIMVALTIAIRQMTLTGPPTEAAQE